MKKVAFIFFLTLLSLSSFSQRDSLLSAGGMMAIKMNLLNFLAKGVGVTVEVGPINRISYAASYSYADINIFDSETKYSSLTLDVKYFPFKKIKTKKIRLYITLYFSKGNNEESYYDSGGFFSPLHDPVLKETLKLSTIACGPGFGCQFILGNLTFDFLAGVGYTYCQKIETSYVSPGYTAYHGSMIKNGFDDIRLGVNVGLIF